MKLVQRKSAPLKPPPSVLAPPLVPASEEDFQAALQQVTQDMEARFGPSIGEGRHRKVYLDQEAKEVVKVPTFMSGIDANFAELDTPPHENLARTWLDESSVQYGIPLLRMEYVEPVLSPDGLPSWAFSIDTWQVGHTHDGRLVAYDWECV